MVIGLIAATSAQAINARYASQLERSGCTQVSEQQGCDIRKTRSENARSGFVTETPGATVAGTPYAGRWIAKGSDGSTVATIRIDSRERVRVNGKRVRAKRSDGALVFRAGKITCVIQGDRRLKGEDTWTDFDAGTGGFIVAE